MNLTFRYSDIHVADRFNQNVWYQLMSDVRLSRRIVFFRQDASRWWATTCTSPKRKRGRLAAHCCLGHPHTLTNPSETSREALGQLLATSSVEHAGKYRKLAWEKAAAICQHQVNALLVRGGFDAELSPGDSPSFLHCLWKKVHFYNIQSPA